MENTYPVPASTLLGVVRDLDIEEHPVCNLWVRRVCIRWLCLYKQKTDITRYAEK